VDRVTC